MNQEQDGRGSHQNQKMTRRSVLVKTASMLGAAVLGSAAVGTTTMATHASGIATPICEGCVPTIPVYRLLHPQTKRHLYTTSLQEAYEAKNHAGYTADPPKDRQGNEIPVEKSIGFTIIALDFPVSGTVFLYRAVRPVLQDDLLTIDPGEYQTQQRKRLHGYTEGGFACARVFPRVYPVYGCTPLYRMVHKKTSVHFYTISLQEAYDSRNNGFIPDFKQELPDTSIACAVFHPDQHSFLPGSIIMYT